MKIVIPFYNVENWIKTCINSLKSQTFKDFKCILIDDISSDSSFEIAKQSISDDPRFTLIKNEEKKFALRNIYEGIRLLNPESDDIIVTIDGDDWLASPDSLEIVNRYYLQSPETLITYGTYIEIPSGIRPFNVTAYSKEVIESRSFREDIWRASHLRTFKYKLWKSINIEDLKDSSGNFYRMAWDLAFMFPMLEMAGDRIKYIQEILYCYNVSNPNNDHKIDHSLQLSTEREIRNKKPYKKIVFDDESKKQEDKVFMSVEEAKQLQFLSHNRWLRNNGEYTHRINYNLDQESVILDWGGFKGEWAEQIYNKYKCNIHIFEAFEKYALFLQNKFLNNSKIKIYNFGVGATSRKVDMIEDDLATRVVDDSLGKMFLVSTDDIIDNFKFIDLLKINIEGLEYEVLDRMIETGDIKKIKNIQVQFHPFTQEYVERYGEVKKKLEQTHSLTYEYEFIWENWILKP